MTVVPLESLPLGFRFHPTDEELINHYLKGKLTGRVKSEAEVIPEVDVCKCEPWDLPDKALIRSDDPEWFFFAPKDRKYPNGHRSNRATEAGYWKATGKDRFIRSKAARKHSSIIGMKKTLVFHRGRAPKGVRTNWIMHEYRTTEPEFESGDQGGYVLYRLFKKPEETSLSSDLDEIDNNTSPLTPTRSSPDDIQHDAVDMEQIATPLNEVPPQSIMQDDDPLILPRSVKSWPVGIKRWSGDKTGCSATYHLETDKNYCKVAPNFHAGEVGVKGDILQDSLAQLADAEYEKIEHDGFPNISSPPLPYADHPFFGNMNQGSDMEYYKVYNSAQDSLDVLLNSMLTNQDQEIPRGSNVLKDSTAEVVPWQNIFDLASYKEIGASSDLDAKEEGFVQGAVGLDASDWTYPHCFIGTERLQMDISDEHPEMKPQLSALYEHISLLPYDSTGQDGYSVVSAAESLQDLSYSMDEPSNQKNIPSSEDGLDGSEIKIRARQLRQQTDENTIVTEQGSATRRIRLQSSIPFSNGDSESRSPPNKHDVEEAISHMLELSGRMEQQNAKRISINGTINETGITIRTRQLQHLSSSNKLVGQKGKAVRRLRSKVQVGAFLGANGLSKRINNVSTERITKAEVGKHVDHHNLDRSNSLGAALLDKLKELSVDDATPSLKIYQEAKPTRSIINHADRNTDLVKRPRKSRGSSIIWVPKWDSAASLFIFLSFLSVILLLLCVRIWGRFPNTQYAYKPRGSSNAWVWKGDSVASLYILLLLLSVILTLLCVGKWGGFRNTRYASKPRSSSITLVWKGDSVASLYIFYSSMSVILLLLCVGIWRMFMNKSICI